MTMEEKIKRINELYHKSKAEGLTEDELEEQKQLRKDYIASVRTNLTSQLDGITVVNPDGTVVDMKKKRKKLHWFMEKALLRKEMKRLRKKMGIEERKSKDIRIYDNLRTLSKFKENEWFYIYVSYGTEADTKRIINYLLEIKCKKNIHVAVPKVIGDEMEFFEIDSLDELKEGCMGILEPDNNRKADAKNAVMVLPGLAFDMEHGRLGYGGGFYDKYLDRYGADKFYKIGICYDFQVQKYDKINLDKNDMKVDIIVTDKAYY